LAGTGAAIPFRLHSRRLAFICRVTTLLPSSYSLLWRARIAYGYRRFSIPRRSNLSGYIRTRRLPFNSAFPQSLRRAYRTHRTLWPVQRILPLTTRTRTNGDTRAVSAIYHRRTRPRLATLPFATHVFLHLQTSLRAPQRAPGGLSSNSATDATAPFHRRRYSI